ncbi:ABC transporter substrate-binding protein [Sulfurivermis fontis]|uniref:ABC transporter substrate-binding protein n=1 Tax=Sulfurivermis fontis TaxID=1972068 RepID=UPI000FDA5370|nr:ABC transporter substrate binding protein [Sulfurivermis fontis]
MASLWRGWSVALLLAVAGCAASPAPSPAPEPATVVVAPPPPKVVAKPAPRPLPRVAIVVSMDTPAYNDVAGALERRLDNRAMRYRLDGTTRAVLERAAPDQIVAIGLEAALFAKPLARPERPVVFCQVFNHVEHDLISPQVHGVAVFPSFRKTFATWRALAPNVREILVFTGPGFETVLTQAVAAASQHGITLTHRSVNSDKEFLYQYKRLSASADGLWLLPDNRILSRNTIQDVMSFSVRNGKQVAVFSEQLLRLGGLFSAVSSPDEIAAKVLLRLDGSGGTAAGSGLLFLDEAEVRINPVIVQRLNLTVPESLRSHVVE